MSRLWSKASLYYHTARHLRRVQICHRLRTKLRGKLFATPLAPPPEETSYQLADITPQTKMLLARLDPAQAISRADGQVMGKFSYVGENVAGWQNVNWQAPEQTRLWRFFLHGSDWAFDLGVAYSKTRNKEYFSRFRNLVNGWIESNRQMRGDAWHPYTTSLRIVNWILASALFAPELDKDPTFRRRLLGSAHFQTSYLSQNLEYDLLANHFLKNIKALFIAGKFFCDAEAIRWRAKAIHLLAGEMEEQILPDGCHFERSPTYHCIVLQDVLDCLLFADTDEAKLQKQLREKAALMVSFLESILFDDGLYPLFNDSAINLGETPAETLAYAKAMLAKRDAPKGSHALETVTKTLHLIWHRQSGYTAVKTPAMKLVVDTGSLGPDYQLGHAHCDLFSFELSIEGHRLVVNSGTPTYQEGKLRAACRSTRAHNTVIIDGQEQAEIWKSFRVARRPMPRDVKVEERDGLVSVEGWHDGYRRLPGHPVHKRSLFLIDGDMLIVLDEILGAGSHSAESFLHLHPSVDIAPGPFSFSCNVQLEELTIQITALEGIIATVESGFYAPSIGATQHAPVIRFESRGRVPVQMAYALAPAKYAIERLQSNEDGKTIIVKCADCRLTLKRSSDGWRLRRKT
jgi:uncharacterized heparinase superfamily protein